MEGEDDMSKMVIEGGVPLEGSIAIHGAKNAVLPILAATLLNAGKNVIYNCPKLKDVTTSLAILECLGCSVLWEGDALIVDSENLENCIVPEKLMREMRSSAIFLGAILSRCERALISTPGGCELGPRPIDLHIKAFRQMGVNIEESHGFITCEANGIRGADIHLSFPSVGATENIMLAAVRCDGQTRITNAAKEPEIEDLQKYLNAMGAKVSGAGTGTVMIEGVEKLHNVTHCVMPDRIVAASYLAAAAATGGAVELVGVVPEHLKPIISVLSDAGCDFKTTQDTLRIIAKKPLVSVNYVRTSPHPGFPTDAQRCVMTPIVNSLAIGLIL